MHNGHMAQTTQLPYMRVSVVEHDSSTLLCRPREGGPNIVVALDEAGHLPKLVRRGSRLNLVCPRMDEGVARPELIIYEPDYLVDVTAVARCFTAYADSPLVALLERLRPRRMTRPILLGLMAGQLLDEQLRDDTPSYGESAREFFRRNALALAAADVGDDFHAQARAQRDNIRRTLDEELPRRAPCYRKGEAVVEPSFICEMLGLQGRMDFLQLDMRLVVEQKSGKGIFRPGDATATSVPGAREEHRVQMALYMAILRYNYGRFLTGGDDASQAFLLYSRYRETLVDVPLDRELLLRAVDMRNRLAAAELDVASGGMGFLAQMRPRHLHEKEVSPVLWKQYVEPEICAVLDPVSAALHIERHYYLRMLRFVWREMVLSKLGDLAYALPREDNAPPASEGSDLGDTRCEPSPQADYGQASLWLSTPEEKREAGSMVDGLTLLSPRKAGERVDTVRLGLGEGQRLEATNFREGDIVLLYPYAPGTPPDARRVIVFRGTLAEMGEDSLTIRLRNEQTDALVLARDGDKSWVVEHDFMEASHSGLCAGLHTLLTAPKERLHLITLNRRPAVDWYATLRGDYGEFNDMMLRVKRARDLFLIVGPPGTGKTSFGMLLTLKEELLEPGSAVLLMAYTNRAVDEMCMRLVEEGIDFLRLGSATSCAKQMWPHLLEERARGCANVEELRQTLAGARVIAGTVHSLSHRTELFALRRFTLAIVDEASQILEPQLAGLLGAHQGRETAIRKFVMIGDHKQLPAVVRQSREDSHVEEADLRAIGLTDCRRSLFERMLERYRDEPSITYTLTRQGRMHGDVADFVSRRFYGGKLRPVPLEHQKEPSHSWRLRFVDMKGEPADGEQGNDKVNPREAEEIARLVYLIYKEKERDRFDALTSVGVIVPYRSQITVVRAALVRSGLPGAENVTVDTVERFQGSQRRHIVYGFTVRRVEQLRFLTDSTFEEDGCVVDRKLNVAMTRARESLTMVGDSDVLRQNDLFSRLIDYVTRRGGYTRAR